MLRTHSHDPFDVTGLVSDDANFCVDGQAIDLARKLQRGQIRSCPGFERLGRPQSSTEYYEIRANYDCVCVMVDCSRDDVSALSASA